MASRTTATPTAAWPSTPTGDVWTVTRSWRCARSPLGARGLVDDTVVATVMSNIGFQQAMERALASGHQTAVGDRYVLEAMRPRLQAGRRAVRARDLLRPRHHRRRDADRAAPGGAVAETGRSWRSWPAVMHRLPQVLVNVPDVDKRGAAAEPGAAAVADAERRLGDTGRVLLRPSGTEPLVRVMVEAADIDQARSVAGRLADVVKSALG